MPEPRDLRAFWRSAERAIEGLNVNVSLSTLTGRGCRNLGPIILGEAAYAILAGKPFSDWDEFREVVEEHFGLTDG